MTQPKTQKGKKLQSAMEYLMTYGWSILIIAVVIAALYELGAFSSTNLAPRAQTNSCRVFRPSGVGTTVNINLQGVCNGELPEYVMHSDGTNPPSVTTKTALPALTQMTVVGWMYAAVNQPSGGGLASADGCFMYMSGAGTTESYEFATWGCGPVPGPYYGMVQMPTKQWVMMAYTVDSSGDVKSYDFESPSTVLTTSATGNVFFIPSNAWNIGGIISTPGQLNGSIADVQVYDTPMSQNDLTTLYLEGIGGEPTELQYLVAWWPLNGDFKDYSGNGYNAQATGNVIFTNSWVSSYIQP